MILLYPKSGIIGNTIGFRTWSSWSHAAWLRLDGKVYHAWHQPVRKGGQVLLADDPWSLHKEGTKIRVLGFDQPPHGVRVYAEQFLEEQLGKKYDFGGVWGFIKRTKGNNPDRWFCSELVSAACRAGGYPLFSDAKPDWKVSPGAIEWSPRVVHVADVDTMGGLKDALWKTDKIF